MASFACGSSWLRRALLVAQAGYVELCLRLSLVMSSFDCGSVWLWQALLVAQSGYDELCLWLSGYGELCLWLSLVMTNCACGCLVMGSFACGSVSLWRALLLAQAGPGISNTNNTNFASRMQHSRLYSIRCSSAFNMVVSLVY
jgi:hypothetical protein